MFSRLSRMSYMLFSLVLAILLAVFVDGQSGTDTSKLSESSSTDTSLIHLNTQKTITLKASLQVTGVDTNRYLISGLPDTVEIEIKGPAAIVVAAENTHNFQVIANLKGLSDGEHKVNLEVKGLNKDLTYTLKTKAVNLSIYQKSSAYFKVTPQYNTDAIAEGYEAGDITTSVSEVTVSGRTTAVNQVAQVVATLDLSRNTKADVSKSVPLQAVDANGNPVDVTLSEASTTLTLPVQAGVGTKSAAVKFVTSNGDAANFTITANVNTVTLTGNMDKLAKVSQISVPVNLKNITAKTTQKVTLSVPDGVNKLSPTSITVTITPKEAE